MRAEVVGEARVAVSGDGRRDKHSKEEGAGIGDEVHVERGF